MNKSKYNYKLLKKLTGRQEKDNKNFKKLKIKWQIELIYWWFIKYKWFK